jgi:hypothetical protein
MAMRRNSEGAVSGEYRNTDRYSQNVCFKLCKVKVKVKVFRYKPDVALGVPAG